MLSMNRVDDVVRMILENGEAYWIHGNKENIPARNEAFKKLNEKLSEYFGLDVSEIKIDKNITEIGAFGVCRRDVNTITMNKYSLITFLHEFFHKITDDEVGVRMISSVIYAKAYPEKFSKLVLDNGILHKVKVL